MEVKNYMETLVWNEVDRIISRHRGACNCDKCRYDIVALALNFLPPHYVVNAKGETFTKVKGLEQQFSVDILTAVSNAIKIVNSQPHHEQSE
jgi:competence protein ComFB